MSLNNAEVSSENVQTLKESVQHELPRLMSSDSRHTEEKLEVFPLPSYYIALTYALFICLELSE